MRSRILQLSVLFLLFVVFVVTVAAQNWNEQRIRGGPYSTPLNWGQNPDPDYDIRTKIAADYAYGVSECASWLITDEDPPGMRFEHSVYSSTTTSVFDDCPYDIDGWTWYQDVDIDSGYCNYDLDMPWE